jgi:hypothetical protein
VSWRSDILSNLETTLKGMTEFADASVITGKAEEVDLDSVTFPLAFILQGPERKAQGPVGFETWDWTVVVEVWCRDSSVETLYAAVHQAISADIYRNAKALNTSRDGGDVMSLDPGRTLSVFQHTYQILYRHPFGTP